ncbi:TetR/AcrR family transcriptional regulator [Streptomyces albidochromogenes]|uniref:TetR/AcrR family transcriptional regulator n=1 Tax=Streptomyces albidochromogenes TaxID=329524 RepID=A0ABW6FGJ0_9ACTN
MVKQANAGPEGPGRRASDQGRFGPLRRERVLAVALDVVDRDGLSGLTMRKLGAELGVEATALYRYAPSKDALLDGVVEEFYRELDHDLTSGPRPTPSPAQDWRAELHRIALAAYDVALRHPHVVPLMCARLLATPLARRPPPILRSDEHVLALLHDAGLDDPSAVRIHRAFTAWLLGYLLVELRAMDDDPDETDPAFRLGLHRIPEREFPRLRATAITLADRGGPVELEAGLDALLRGGPLPRTTRRMEH